jgi:predicted transglutaminase-like cysteine proteinase
MNLLDSLRKLLGAPQRAEALEVQLKESEALLKATENEHVSLSNAYDDLSERFDASQDVVKDLQEELVFLKRKPATEVFFAANFAKCGNISYKQKRKSPRKNDYSVTLRELVTPASFEVSKYRKLVLNKNVLSKELSTYEQIDVLSKKVACDMVWTDDKNLDQSGDYYLLPAEILVDGRGDCEDHALLMMSLHEEIAGAWGFHDDGKNRYAHAFNVFVHKGELYILDTVGNVPVIYPWNSKGGKEYEIYFVITRESTYRITFGVEFGELAGWD